MALASIDNPGGSSIILGLHRAGYAIPINVSGVEVGGGETAYTMRPATGRDEFLLFMSDTLAITAVSHETMTMLGVRVRSPARIRCHARPHHCPHMGLVRVECTRYPAACSQCLSVNCTDSLCSACVP